MAAILSWPQCVNGMTVLEQAYMWDELLEAISQRLEVGLCLSIRFDKGLNNNISLYFPPILVQ